MQLSFRTKLFIGQVSLVGVVVAIVAYQLNNTLAFDLRAQVAQRLERQAIGGTKWLSQNRHPERLASRMSDLIGADVTIFDQSGAVIAASDGAPVDVEGELPPEVKAALAEGKGTDDRVDDGRSFVHVAVRAPENVLRLSAPLVEVESTVGAMRNRLWYASLVGVFAAVLLGVGGSYFAARPLRKMTAAAGRISRGEYDVTLPEPTPDDFGRLADALGSLAAQLKRDMGRIERLERVRRDFVANVSHELRTPVTAIKGYAETLMDGVPDKESEHEFLDALMRHADRIELLVRDLLQLAKLEAEAKEERVRDPVDVRAIAGHVARAASARHRDDLLNVEIDMSDAGLVACADPLAVEQVLDNLLDNAVKYASPPRRITIDGRRDGDIVEVAVADNGPGIAAEHRDRVFERFYRVPSAETAHREGTGLGLAITKHLVEAMGGTIELEDGLEGGSRFVVRLPAQM